MCIKTPSCDHLARVLKLIGILITMDDLNYLDLIILKKIDADSTVEKFGTQINTSFFETANILGTLKVKGLIEIETSIGGASPVRLTDEGKETIEHASRKASEEIDGLDRAVLSSLGSGIRDLPTLAGAMNIRSKDLAFHLNKLKVSDYLDYDVRSGKIFLSLTEKGFNLTGGVRANVPKPQETSAPAQEAGTAAAQLKQAESVPDSALVMPLSKPKAQGMWASLFGAKGKGEAKKAAPSDIAEILDEAGAPVAAKPSGTQQSSSTSGWAPWVRKPSEAKATPSTSAPGNPPWAKPAGKSQVPSGPVSPQQSSVPKAPPAKPSAPQAEKMPAQRTLADIAEEKPQKPEDINTVRMRTKIEFYIKEYLGYAIMVLIFLGIILYALSILRSYKLTA